MAEDLAALSIDLAAPVSYHVPVENRRGEIVWNVTEYQRFGDERTRPFFDLIARVPDMPVTRAADLGCGTGALTAVISDRWPQARVTGVDSSPEMLRDALTRARAGRLEFVEQDIARWRPAEPVDLILSNAALHWVADHDQLLEDLARSLVEGGRLAVQMPGNFGAPSHTAIKELAGSPAWKHRLEGATHPENVRSLDWYVEKLAALGFEAIDAWETTYGHLLPGEDAVLRWVEGTALRPVLERLDDDEKLRFREALAQLLRHHYPPRPHGTWFPFRRLFFVARKCRK